MYCTTHIISHAVISVISNRIATINGVFILTYQLAPLFQVRGILWQPMRGERKVETDMNHMYMYTTTNTASRGGGDSR